MPDGERVRHIAGGSDDSDAPGDSEAAVEMQKQLKEARAEAAKNRKALREMQDKVEGIDLDEYTALKKQAEATAKQKEEEKGNYDKLLSDEKRKFEAQLAKVNESNTAWKSRFETLVVDNELLSAAGNAINPKAAMTLIRSEYAFNVHDDGSVEIAAGADVLYDSEGRAMKPGALMQKYLADNPYLVKASESKGGSSREAQKDAPNAAKNTQAKVRDGLAALLGG